MVEVEFAVIKTEVDDEEIVRSADLLFSAVGYVFIIKSGEIYEIIVDHFKINFFGNLHIFLVAHLTASDSIFRLGLVVEFLDFLNDFSLIFGTSVFLIDI